MWIFSSRLDRLYKIVANVKGWQPGSWQVCEQKSSWVLQTQTKVL